MKGPVKITEPSPEGDLRVAKTVYDIHFNSPSSGAARVLKIEGTFDHDLGVEARAIFKLLVENGWVSNPVMSRTVYYDRHLFIHAEPDEKKPPAPKV